MLYSQTAIMQTTIRIILFFDPAAMDTMKQKTAITEQTTALIFDVLA